MTRNDKEYLMREIISAGSMLLTLWLMKKMHDGTTGKTLKMTLARSIKHFAQNQADGWQKVADIAATNYNKARL